MTEHPRSCASGTGVTGEVQNKPRPSPWRLALGILLTVGILALAYVNRTWIAEALSLARTASPQWLALALGIILGSYLLSSQIFHVVLHSMGHRLGVIRLWATTMVAIVASQSVPVGGAGSYAFLLHNFRRHGIPSGQAALATTLEVLSYIGAMVLFTIFGLAFLATHTLAANLGHEALLASFLAVGVALLLIATVAFIWTRDEATLSRWFMAVHRSLRRILRRPRNEQWVQHTVAELMRSRTLIAQQPRMISLLFLIQLGALSGHSLALYVILLSLGVHISFLAVLAAFGITLLTSTINILPGGGGTVEAALAAVLAQLGAGAAAVPAAIVFRLLNFWALLPLSAVCYAWLMHGRPHVPSREDSVSRTSGPA